MRDISRTFRSCGFVACAVLELQPYATSSRAPQGARAIFALFKKMHLLRTVCKLDHRDDREICHSRAYLFINDCHLEYLLNLFLNNYFLINN